MKSFFSLPLLFFSSFLGYVESFVFLYMYTPTMRYFTGVARNYVIFFPLGLTLLLSSCLNGHWGSRQNHRKTPHRPNDGQPTFNLFFFTLPGLFLFSIFRRIYIVNYISLLSSYLCWKINKQPARNSILASSLAITRPLDELRRPFNCKLFRFIVPAVLKLLIPEGGKAPRRKLLNCGVKVSNFRTFVALVKLAELVSFIRWVLF